MDPPPVPDRPSSHEDLTPSGGSDQPTLPGRKTVSFSDPVRGNLTFDRSDPAQAIAYDLILSRAVERLADVDQLAFTRLVFPSAEGSRLPHIIGSAWLVNEALNNLRRNSPEHTEEIDDWAVAVSAATALHDVGHIAPGSHVAWRIWSSDQKDHHEEFSRRFVAEDPEIREVLGKYGEDTIERVLEILDESPSIPPWTWQLVSGGAWNSDRGDWLLKDRIMCGMDPITSQTQYLVNALGLTDSEPRYLAVDETRIRSVEKFLINRDEMYGQVYLHRIAITGEILGRGIVRRARELLTAEEEVFAAEPVKSFLEMKDLKSISLDLARDMTESMWGAHLVMWSRSEDPILSDLCDRLRHRRLLKNVRVPRDNSEEEEVVEARRDALLVVAKDEVRKAGYDPDYYAVPFKTRGKRTKELDRALRVINPDGSVSTLDEVSESIRRLTEPRTPTHYIAVHPDVRDTLLATRDFWKA